MLEPPRPDKKPDGAPQRAARRLKVFEPATLEVDGAERRIHLLDLSRTGALCHAAQPPAKGAAVTIRLRGTPLAATIMWVDGARFGIAFGEPLGEAQIAAVMGDGA